MPYDNSCTLWPDQSAAFFRDSRLRHQQQSGPHCVSTVLAMLSGRAPEDFQGAMNTQDPVSWSHVLRPYGMKLAYCPTDARKLKHYQSELSALDDLFTLSYYTGAGSGILREPDESGWICGSHIVILQGEVVLDPVGTGPALFTEHPCRECHTKRIFRLVPADHERGL